MGLGSADAEEGALLVPGKRQVDGHERAMVERGRLPPLDDGGDDIRREAAKRGELGKSAAAATSLGGDAGERTVGLIEQQLPGDARLGDESDQLLVALGRRWWGLRARDDEPQFVPATDANRVADQNDGLMLDGVDGLPECDEQPRWVDRYDQDAFGIEHDLGRDSADPLQSDRGWRHCAASPPSGHRSP